MRAVVLAVACLACRPHGSRTHLPQERLRSTSRPGRQMVQDVDHAMLGDGSLTELRKSLSHRQVETSQALARLLLPVSGPGFASQLVASPAASSGNPLARMCTRRADMSMMLQGTKTLPKLTSEDLRALNADRPLLKKMRTGWSGNGMVVMDIKVDSDIIWDLLLDYRRYSSYISTVKDVRVTAQAAGGDPDLTLATFVVSKFRFVVSVVHKFDKANQQLSFYLDGASRNMIMKEVEGTWHVQSKAEGLRPGHVRVWLLSSLRVSRMVPKWIVDYAAERALQRASSWMRPLAEARATKKRSAQRPQGTNSGRPSPV